MTTRHFTRDEILDRLHNTIDSGHPILCATAGNGLIARSLEAGNVDLLLTSVTGAARQRGLPSIAWRLSENNAYVRAAIQEIAEVTSETPLIASVGATHEPAGCNFGDLVGSYTDLGYSGVLNYPTVGEFDSPRFAESMDEFIARGAAPGASDFERRMADAARVHRADLSTQAARGDGFASEVELIAAAHHGGVFTMAYAWSTDEAVNMAKAGADIIVGHCGGTAGGSAGAAMITHEQAAAWLNSIFDAARNVRPDVLLMGHGGPFATPQDTRYLYRLTGAVGFLSGSAVERIPVEKAVRDAVLEFKNTELSQDAPKDE